MTGKNKFFTSLGLAILLGLVGVYFFVGSQEEVSDPNLGEVEVVTSESTDSEFYDDPYEDNSVSEEHEEVVQFEDDAEEHNYSDDEFDYSTAETMAQPQAFLEDQFIGEFLEDLSDEERTAIELQSLQNSISDRIDDLAPGSLSEEEMTQLFDDIDFLNENNVFLGEEAEQLKIYAQSIVGS